MRESPHHIIGLTGLPSSGKGEVADALLKLARDRGWPAEHLSFSDQIKEEARCRGIPDEEFTRELLSRIGIEMREVKGPEVLAERIARKIQNRPEPRPEFFVVEALRHVAEIETLRRTFGKKFVLVAVESDPRIIARRLIARRRPDESPEALQSEENAVQLLEREMNGQLSELGPNVGECMARADARLPNNGTLEELRRSVGQLFHSLTAQGHI